MNSLFLSMANVKFYSLIYTKKLSTLNSMRLLNQEFDLYLEPLTYEQLTLYNKFWNSSTESHRT